MKVVKPAKLPVLSRVVELARQPYFHVAGMLGFPLASPRALLHEMGFWKAVSDALGEDAIVDEGTAKSRGELLVGGSFFAPGGKPIPASFVRARVGAVDKRLAILGDREWHDGVSTAPRPIATVPVDWAHAFGGPKFDRNPKGKGASAVDVGGRSVHLLPNVERYGALLRSPHERPEPAGMRAFDLSFPQRRLRAGTYDKGWLEHHFPGMPPDTEPTFFNMAPEDQWLAEGYFRGDEPFAVENMHPDLPSLEGQLPGLVARCFVTQRERGGERFFEVPLRLDTVWLFPSVGVGLVGFHGVIRSSDDDAEDVAHVVWGCEELGAAGRPIEHYKACLARRLDKDKSALAEMSDVDLMPPRESGVVPDIGGLDIGAWVKSDNLMLKRSHAGLTRKLDGAREHLAAAGMLNEANAHKLATPPLPELPPMDDLGALQSFYERHEEHDTGQLKELQAKKAEADARGRADYGKMGLDYDKELEAAQRRAAGPPKFSAAEQLKRMHAEVSKGREIGIPMLAFERSIADPRFEERLVEQERGVRELYRMMAHLQPAPFPQEDDASARLRTLIQIARDAGESLAGRDFTGADLSGIVLAGADLEGAFLEAADLTGADLSGCNLRGAVLAKADLKDAKLDGALLTGANLGAATLDGATFDGADLTGAVLGRAHLGGARFRGARLEAVDWLEAKPGAVDLSEAHLSQATFIKCDFRGSVFRGADLREATFVESDVSGCDFAHARLQKASFITTDATRASFRDADGPQWVVLHGSRLDEADLRDAKLGRACLRGTSLARARLDRADLAGADLSQCCLEGASLDRARLDGALLIRSKLGQASLEGASLVDGLISKASIPGARFTGANLHGADLSRVVGDAATSFEGAEVGRVRFLPKGKSEP